MKNFLKVALAVALAATMAISSFATTTDWEDDRAEGLSVNNREADGTAADGFNWFRNEFTNSHENDPDRSTNFIIKEDNGNRCVQITAPEAWQSDWYLGTGVFSIKMKPTSFGTFQGIFLYQNPYELSAADLALTDDSYLGTGCGMTIKDKNTVVLYANLDSVITYEFNTGIDLTADWHTYAAYDDEGDVTFTIDNKVVGKINIWDGAIKDADGAEKAKAAGDLYDDDTREGFAFTGAGMDILIDNLSIVGFDAVPTDKFVAGETPEAVPDPVDKCFIYEAEGFRLSFDTLFMDDVSMMDEFGVGDGHANTVINDYAITAEDTIKVRGWAGFEDHEEFDLTYGYAVNEGEVVYSEDFLCQRDDVVAAIGEFANGFEVEVPVNADATLVQIWCKDANGVETMFIEFSVNGEYEKAGDPTPVEDPTPVTPDDPTPVKPATPTADLAVVAILALGAYAVAKKH